MRCSDGLFFPPIHLVTLINTRYLYFQIPLPEDPAEKRRVKRKAQKHVNITKQNASNIEQAHQQQPLLRDQQQSER